MPCIQKKQKTFLVDLLNTPTNVSSFSNDVGYLTSFTESDPVFGIHVSSGILAGDITNWNTAFGWGDHSAAGYLTSFTELDPIFSLWDKSTGISITEGQIADLNHFSTADETDPVFSNLFNIISPANNQLLKYNSGTSKWTNWTPNFLTTEVDGDITNEIQDLNFAGNILTITNKTSPTSIDLSPFLDNTNFWTQSGDTIYNLGNVGIGTTSPQGRLEVQGDGLEVPDEPLFEVKRKDGQTVFAVYPEGVRIYIEESTSKGTKGGFAVGGFSPVKGITNEYLRVTQDSVRVYVNDDGLKGTKGGFAVGGYSPVKGYTNEYLRVSPDSVRIYVEGETVKGTKGGFAVGGISPFKGITDEYLRVTPDSVRIYVDSDGAKGTKGGFAVGGFSPVKGIDQEYLRVTPDSVRVYINDNPTTKGTKGGFAVGGFSPLKGLTGDYMNVSGKSTAEIINPSEPRVLWYPNKEAFLTGRVLIESAANVGTNSMATGFESKASGDYSQAFGYKPQANGDNSTAIGNYANAGGNQSYAIGNYAQSTKVGSYAIGSGASATGSFSYSVGSIGVDSLGNTTDATQATGDYSYAFGMGSIASGRGAFAFGTINKALGDYSLAMGYENESTHNINTAIGYQNTSKGWGTTVLGVGSVADGLYSVAIGLSAKSIGGYYSFSIGANTLSSGDVSLAMGGGSIARGDFSTALGYMTIARSLYSTVIGVYNDTITSSSLTSWVDTDPLFIIGNGQSLSTRSNALTILKNGKVGIGTTTPTQLMDVRGNMYLQGNLGLGVSSPTYKLQVQGNAIFADDIYLRDGSTTSGDNLVRIYDSSDDGIIDVYQNNAVKIRLRGNGNTYFTGGKVGIGTTNPNAMLLVVDNAANIGAIRSESQYSGSTVHYAAAFNANNGTNGIGCYAAGSSRDFYAGGPGTNYFPFTGSHEVKLVEGFPVDPKPGIIVSATGNTAKRFKKDGTVSLSSTLPEIQISRKNNDKSVFGVFVSEDVLPDDHWYSEKGRFGIINAVGEGRVWVCEFNGNVESGDYITTSNVPGYGKKQDDDLLHNYTLGKAIETVDWDNVNETIEHNGKTYKIYLIAVIYTSG